MNLRILAQKLLGKYERFISPFTFVAGFAWDSLTLTRIDLWLDNIILITYLAVASAGILITNSLRNDGRVRFRLLAQYTAFLPLPIQFAFGGLFSGFLIFYSRSASLFGSWPFVIFLALLLIGNEFFRQRYARFIFQIGVFFIASFSYAIFALPIIIGKMGAAVFLLSGLVSLAATALLVFCVFMASRDHIRQHQKALFGSICAIYLGFNILYFTNIIPPIPLSLKEIGVYHSVIREPNGEYLLLAEPPSSFSAFSNYSRVFHRSGDEAAYVYGAVFAPTALTTNILHRWTYFDETKRKWIETDKIAFAIYGGRDGGYRGFSMKQNIIPGKWQVDVITERNQVLGRIRFRVVPAESPPDLKAIQR